MNNTTSDDPDRPPVRTRTRSSNPGSPPAASPPTPEVCASPAAERGGAAPKAQPQVGKDESYEVGYGKPPRHSQFKAGYDPRRPRGRKPGAKNKANAIAAMMESPVTVRTPEGAVHTITTHEAMMRKLRELALGGNLPAIIKSVELYLKLNPPPPLVESAAGTAPEMTATDFAILEEFKAEILAEIAEEAKKSGAKQENKP